MQVLSTHRPEPHLKPTGWSHCASILQTVLTLGPGTSRRSSCCAHTADGAVYSAGLLNTVRGVLVTALLHFPPKERNDLKSENESLKPTGQNQSHSLQRKAETPPEVSGEELETTLGLLP